MAQQEAALAAHQTEGEEACEDFQELEKLQTLGIAAGDIKKCREAGIHTVKGVMMVTKKTLGNIKGISEAKVDKIMDAARKIDKSGGWQTGAEVANQREKEVLKISSGCTALNEALGGGFETKSLTELYGEYRTGKTQICLTLCVTCQLPTNMGGAAGKVAFIDTENTFRPERIRPIAERFNLDPEPVLENIVIARAYTHEHQMDLLVSVTALMAEEPFKLLIMDSLMGNFRSEFIGRGELADRQQKLGQMLARLRRISEEFNVAVVFTNQVISDPGGGAMFVSDPKKPIGGHVVAHASTTRISLRKGKAEQRLAKIVHSPCLPEAEASFTLAPEGVTDYKD